MESEVIAVIVFKGNQIYLPKEVIQEFEIKKGDRLVFYKDYDKMILRIQRKAKT